MLQNIRNDTKIYESEMKQINYKIKKGHVSYLWRGEGKRLYKSLYKSSWFIKNNLTELLVKQNNKI
jgi:hypothetical protein